MTVDYGSPPPDVWRKNWARADPSCGFRSQLMGRKARPHAHQMHDGPVVDFTPPYLLLQPSYYTRTAVARIAPTPEALSAATMSLLMFRPAWPVRRHAAWFLTSMFSHIVGGRLRVGVAATS